MQFEAINRYVHQGGSVLFMVGEGGEANLGTNVNYLLEEYVLIKCFCRLKIMLTMYIFAFR